MIEIDVEQGSPEWFAYRHGIPTASRASDIITPARGGLSASWPLYAGELIEEIQNPGDNDDAFSTYWTERGRVLEAEAISWYEMKTGHKVNPGGIILSDDRTRAVSPDGKIENEDGPNILLEVKCLSPKHHIKALLSDKEYPDEYKPQVHAGLSIADGYDFTTFLMYCPGYQELIVHVERDEYTQKVTAALDVFCENLEIAKEKVLK